MARRGRPRRCTSVARLVDKAEKEEEEGKAKKLRSTKKQPEQQDQQTSNHSIEPATNVVTPSTAGKATIGKSVILTRAARRKAGIPPPTPLFRGGAKHLKTKTSSWQKQPTSSNSSSSTSSSSDEDVSVKPLWVQCDHRSCQKWRKLPPGTKIDIKENWYCCMHPDPTYQSCDTPEEKCPRSKKRAFTFSKLSAGQLIWARLKGFPPWPAVVSPDPWSDGDYISEYREGCIYHVEFLGKMRTHSWVPEEQVEPYHCQTLCSLGEIRKSKRLEYALSEADSYATLSDQERLNKCEYTDNAVKVEDFKPQTQAQNSASNPSQNAQLGRPTTSTTNNRKGHPSNSSKIAIQASSQPLRDRTNNSSITANSASSQISMTGAHEDLFKTLGMGTNERNHINLVANTLIQQIKAQVLAALGQSAVETTARIETPRASVQRTTASTQGNAAPVDKSTSSSTTIGTQQQPKPDPSSTNMPQRASPTSRLTQTSLELSPDNQVKLVTTKQAGRRNDNHRQTSKKQNTKRKRQSPLAQAGGGKRTKGKRSGMELVSPTIRDYFKTSGSESSKAPLRGAPQLIAKDQEVPIIATSSAAAALSGNYTFEFQSLEMEAESELAQIETMLSMFDDIPATTCTSSGKDMSQDTDTTTRTVLDVQSQGQSSDREQSLKQMVVTDKVSSGDRCSGGRVTGGGDDMDIESILQEMNTIDDLLQDLSQAQVVPY